jgi:hypothetical protein
MQENAGYSNGLERLEVIRKLNARREWINTDLYRLMFKQDLYVLAYERIKSHPGNMTPGTDDFSRVGGAVRPCASCPYPVSLRVGFSHAPLKYPNTFYHLPVMGQQRGIRRGLTPLMVYLLGTQTRHSLNLGLLSQDCS